MPLYDGYEWEDYKGGPSSANGVNDTKGLVQSTLETYAQAMGIPKSLITGEVQDTSKAIDQLLTLCIDPLLENIADEINRKNYSKQDLLNGTRVRFNTNAMKHIDLIDVAQSIDKLISSGFACINDLRELCHMDLIDEPWANEFFMTKNYSKIEDIVNQIETGRKEE
jgi:HK97 family phage portal protein